MYDLARHSDKIPTFPALRIHRQPHLVLTHNIRYINMCCLWFNGWAFMMVVPSCSPASHLHSIFPTCELNCITMTYRILYGKALVRQHFKRTPYSSCTQIKLCTSLSNIGKSQTFYRPISGKKIQYT